MDEDFDTQDEYIDPWVAIDLENKARDARRWAAYVEGQRRMTLRRRNRYFVESLFWLGVVALLAGAVLIFGS